MMYPQFLSPHLFPPDIPVLGFVRWYGLMYLLGIILGFFFLKHYIEKGKLKIPLEEKGGLYDLVFYIILGILLGARLGYFLFYKILPMGIFAVAPHVFPEGTTLSAFFFNPIEIIGFHYANGSLSFQGLSGMAFHGGAIGVIVSVFIYCKRYNVSFLNIADWIIIPVPIGLFFGRLGNFLNAELYGRETISRVPEQVTQTLTAVATNVESAVTNVITNATTVTNTVTTVVTNSLLGMRFPLYDRFGGYQNWRDAYNNMDWEKLKSLSGESGLYEQELSKFYTAPRHPSQLYEAFLEGALLFLVAFFLMKMTERWKIKEGVRFFVFIALYGLFRFLIEFVRDPNEWTAGWLTAGMAYSLPMFIIGGVFAVVMQLRKPKSRN